MRDECGTPQIAQPRYREQILPQKQAFAVSQFHFAGPIAQVGGLHLLPALVKQACDKAVGQRAIGVWQVEKAGAQQRHHGRHSCTLLRQSQCRQRIANHRRAIQGDTGGKINRQAVVVFSQAVELAAQQIIQCDPIPGHIA
jgi:hypothetical protein